MQRVEIRVCLPDTHAAHDLLLARKTSPMSLQTSVNIYVSFSIQWKEVNRVCKTIWEHLISLCLFHITYLLLFKTYQV